MERYIKKADVLLEALPYIQKFRNKTFVIKYGGSIIGHNDFAETVLQDLVFMECIGINPVLVHGGGHAINTELRKNGCQPEFEKGLRITTEKVLETVKNVLEDKVNKQIVDRIISLGGSARGLSGRNGILESKKHLLPVTDSDAGVTTLKNIGFVGDITRVIAGPVTEIINQEYIPVIAPLGFDQEGNIYNLNADIAAGKIAASLHAQKLIYLTNVEGIMRDINDQASLISTIKSSDIEIFINSGIIKGGMIPKVNSAIQAIKNNIQKTHIIDGRIPHSLLLEIFTDEGIGTEIIN